MKDDRGHFLAVGASLFAAASLYRSDRARLERIMTWLARNGVDYIRALACVGAQPFWAGREVDPKRAGWRDDIAGTTALAWACGLRVQWTLFGDADAMVPSLSERQRVADTVADVCREQREAVIAAEGANESWQNGFSGAGGVEQLRGLVRRFADRVDVPIAVSCPSGADEHGQQESARALYDGSAATFTTNHYDRDMKEDGWRPVRQPWQVLSYGGVPKAAANNEPIGIGTPGGNNPTDDNPHRQVAAIVVSYISGHWGYVLHDRTAGVRCDRDWSDVPNIDRIMAGVQAIKRLLPADLPNWSPQNDHWTGHPFERVQKWVDGAATGVTRAYAAVDGKRFVCLPMGIKGGVALTAKRAMRVDVYDVLSGEGEPQDLGVSQSVWLTDNHPVYLVRGTTQ